MSLRGLPKREFAVRSGMPLIKRILFNIAGSKYDRMAGEKGSITSSSSIKTEKDWKSFRPFSRRHTWKCLSMRFLEHEEVNKALRKVASGVSKGKTVLRVF